MPPNSIQSFNSTSAKSKSGIVKKILLGTLIIALAVSGYFLRPVVDGWAYRDAESFGQEYISLLTTGSYEDAYVLGTSVLQTQTGDAKGFKDSLGDIETSEINIKEASSKRYGNVVHYAAAVDNLPENKAGSTEGVFEIVMIKTNGQWQVSNVSVN